MRRHRLCRCPFVVAWSALGAFVWMTVKLHGKLYESPGLRSNPDDIHRLSLRDHFVNRHHNATTRNQSFAACLLVMDDNHFLIEWLAYHYFALSLSRVIVAVDPRSATSPAAILRRWKGRIQTERWDDADYMTTEELEQAEHHVRKFFKHGIADQPQLVRHRARQRLFYYKCMKRLKAEGRSWVAMFDTDEFLSVNHDTVKKMDLEAFAIDRRGSILSFLQREVQRPGNNLSSACVQIPRIRFGAVESTYQQVKRRVPAAFNASHFQTLRWRKHAAPRNVVHNKISKTIIDLSRVDWGVLAPVDSIHRPIMSLCGHRRLYIQSKDQLFVLYHYLGSLEQVSLLSPFLDRETLQLDLTSCLSDSVLLP
jgi:hypothetical protein